MPKVNRVNKARNDQGTCGKCGCEIKAGDAYVWWKFRYGGRSVRCAKSECGPRPSDLTQSEFLSTLYDLQDRSFEGETCEDLRSQLDDLRDEVQNLLDETQGKLDNMPEGLQQGDTGQLLQERIDNLDSVISDIESIDTEWDKDEPTQNKNEDGEEITESEDEYEKRKAEWQDELNQFLEEKWQEAIDALSNCS